MLNTLQKIENLESFLSDAWCIDGECKFQGVSKSCLYQKTHTEVPVFKLTDSKRGEFLISVSKVK